MKKIIVFIGIVFLVNSIITLVWHYKISAATCMTTAQVQSDSRCLYILNGKVYYMGTNTPHHGHPCRTDVGSSPSSHADGRLAPLVIANICPAVTITPTPTVTPLPTHSPTVSPTVPVGASAKMFTVTLFLHGLYHSGDNVNPTGVGNLQPVHQQRQITIQVFDANNTLVVLQQGTIMANAAAGNFTGTVSVNLPDGQYTIHVSTTSFLSKSIPGFQQITSAINYSLPPIALTAGDANNDGQIDISDYNALISCYGTKQQTASCSSAQAPDFNDDGFVDGIDYNLFLRELSVQKGM
jgi:hypothetical protein